MNGLKLAVAVGLLGAAWVFVAGFGVRRRAGGSRVGSGSGGSLLDWLRLSPKESGARWATRADLRPLLVRSARAGRLVLGRAGRHLIAAEHGSSVLVVGPTQSRKTSGFAVPAVLEWEGPVVAASVKSDLARHTLAWRDGLGNVAVYDPSGVTGIGGAKWSPLLGASTWSGARRVASSLTEVARSSAGSLTDGDFWYSAAAKLLGPLLMAAAVSGRTMTDVVRWLDDQETTEIAEALDAAGAVEALQAVQACWTRDDRQRSAVYSTAETVVESFADPAVAASARHGDAIDPEGLIDGCNTLYLCAPAHDQRRLRPVFATLVSQVIASAYERAESTGRALEPRLLVVLDEAANVAPVAELDVLASTASGHGVQLVTVWQDFGQIHARYGSRAGSVVNNHRAKVFLSGISDPQTLEHASQLIGETEHDTLATTFDRNKGSSTTRSVSVRRLLPADGLRRVPPGKAVLISGHLPPARLSLRPWQEERSLWERARVTR